MDYLPLTPCDSQHCPSLSSKDQGYRPNTSLQSVPLPWQLPTYSMVHSNPTTPDAQEVTFYTESGSLNSSAGPTDYLHAKSLSNGSMGESQGNFSHDFRLFAPIDARQPHNGHPLFQQHDLRLSDPRHFPASYAAAAHMQPNNHGPPLARHQSLTYGGASITQQMPSNFARLSGVQANGNENGTSIRRNMPANPALYTFAFNGLEMPPSPSAPVGDWNPVQSNNQGYSHAQGMLAVLPPAYGPTAVLSSPTTMGSQEFQELYTNPCIQAQIQEYLQLGNRVNGSNAAPAHGMIVTGSNVACGSFESASAPGLGFGVSGGTPGHTRPQSQSTQSTPSLAGNSPTLPWSSPLEPSSQGSGSSTGCTSFPPPMIRAPLTPPKLVDPAMPIRSSPPNATQKKAKSPASIATATPRHRSCGANTSVSSVRSAESISPSAVPVSPPSTPSVTLRARVAALPKDKRLMFERAAGDLWDPNSPREDHEVGLDRSLAMLLEDLYDLIGSDELRTQSEIPDELVEPILQTLLLPRAEAHRGSRGGAAGHACLWAGCGKTIKRLDHSRNHIREHCKSKPHTCGGQGLKGCGQTFLRMDDLKRHQKSHCSVLRSGPGRRPRSIRGTRRETDEDERDSEDSTSLNGGDDDDYRPIQTRSQPSQASSSTSTTRELASRLRSQRQRSTRYIEGDSTGESDSGHHDHVAGRLQTSNVRRAVKSLVEQACEGDGGKEDRSGDYADFQKVWLVYSALMASCSLQLITAPNACSFYLVSVPLTERGKSGVEVVLFINVLVLSDIKIKSKNPHLCSTATSSEANSNDCEMGSRLWVIGHRGLTANGLFNTILQIFNAPSVIMYLLHRADPRLSWRDDFTKQPPPPPPP